MQYLCEIDYDSMERVGGIDNYYGDEKLKI